MALVRSERASGRRRELRDRAAHEPGEGERNETPIQATGRGLGCEALKNGNKTTIILALSRFNDLFWRHKTGIPNDGLWITMLRNSSKLKLGMRHENSLH